MLVRDFMSSPAEVVDPKTDVQSALKRMRDHRFRRLPVVNSKGRLVGIVTERDLLHASPSPATSLSIWELNYLLSHLTVDKVMTKSAIVVGLDTLVDTAAQIMLEKRIGGMPVVDDRGSVVGVITESDIFRAFLSMRTAPAGALAG